MLRGFHIIFTCCSDKTSELLFTAILKFSYLVGRSGMSGLNNDMAIFYDYDFSLPTVG